MLRATGSVDTAPMPAADTAREFVLTLRHTADGAPCGTLRVVGQQGDVAFDGWIELIGLITAARGTNMDNAATIRTAYERISAGDLSGFGDLVADDFVEHEEIPGLSATKDGMLEWFRLLLVAFPDFRMEVDDLLADGDKTVARVTATATHQGEFMGVSPTSNRVEIQIIDIMRFDDDGLVCEHWGLADMMSLMEQLGAVPA
jgi:predicted ester cyclase